MNKQIKKLRSFKKTITISGYGLLAAIWLAAMLPIGYTYGSEAQTFALWWTIMSSLGLLVPPMTGYIIGLFLPNSGSKLDSHFNGITFAIAAFWLYLSLTLISSLYGPDLYKQVSSPVFIMLSTLPSWITIGTMILFRVYVLRKTTKRIDVTEHHYFQVLLIGGFAVSTIALLFGQSYGDVSSYIETAFVVAVSSLLSWMIYAQLGALNLRTKSARFTITLIATSIALGYCSFAGQIFDPGEGAESILKLVSYCAGILTFVVYLLILRRSLLK